MPGIERMAVIGYLKVLAYLTPSKCDIPACRDPHASVGTFKESAPTPLRDASRCIFWGNFHKVVFNCIINDANR